MIDSRKMQLTGRLANYPRRPIVDLNQIVRRSRSDTLRSGTHITVPPSTADVFAPAPCPARPALPRRQGTAHGSAALDINLSANRIPHQPGSVLNDHLYSFPVVVCRRSTRLQINSNPSESAIARRGITCYDYFTIGSAIDGVSAAPAYRSTDLYARTAQRRSLRSRNNL